MSRKDAVTGRGPMSGNNRSKALNITKRKWNLNLQPVTVIIDGKKQKIMMSTKTIRTMKKKGQLK
jgi:large subunit ribosomal protein L28